MDTVAQGVPRIWRGALVAGVPSRIVCAAGRITALDPDLEPPTLSGSRGTAGAAAPAVLDARGFVALPRLADAHVHLDKTLWGATWYPHVAADSVLERVAIEQDLLESDLVEPVAVRAERLLAHLVARGATAIRSHVDVSGSLGLARLEPLLELRERWREVVDLELVAFPQEGVQRAAGTTSALRAAVAAGCDVIGGLDPAEVDGDREGQLSFLVDLAAQSGRALDLHLHERGASGVATLERLAALVAASGLAGRCAVSHGFALADLACSDPRNLDRLAETLAGAGISLVTSLPGGRLHPPLGVLRARGVEVVVASDNIRDSWSPFGDGDPLARARLAAYLEDWRTDAELAGALELVSGAPSRLLGLPPARLAPGDLADFTLVRADSLAEAVVAGPAARVVIRRGSVVAGAHHLGVNPDPRAEACTPDR